ncbi:MAG: hypothetical protein RL095_1237 [Verrucomicrobiota bacterium]|jgi:flagellar biosynthetic protein FlhB
MSNADPSKTEKPTSKRLNDARDKGDIPLSQDVVSVAALLAGFLGFALLLPEIMRACRGILVASFKMPGIGKQWQVPEMMDGAFAALLPLLLPLGILAIAIAAATLASLYFQVGFFFDTKPLEIKWDAMNPANGMKQLLPNRDQFMRLAITLTKVALLSIFCWVWIVGDLQSNLDLIESDLASGASLMLWNAFKLAMAVLFVYAILAAVDAWWKHTRHIDKLMMSKQEVKDEHRNAEGDPKVKAKIRAKMRELMGRSLKKEVSKGTVVVTNPTHVAVVLQYVSGEPAPRVLAKGLRKRAERIKALAREMQIPIIEAPPLARALYRAVPDGAYIENRFFTAVAAILAKVYKARRRRRG